MFERIENLIGKDMLCGIKNKTVLIIGLGGVGGSCVLSLIRSGIEKLIIVDFDVIEASNLNRQVISFQDEIGNKKIDSCERIVKRINPNCEIIKYDCFLDESNIKSIFDKYRIDYVVDACDSIRTKQSIIRTCLNKKIKFISCMGTGNKLDPTKLEITDIRKTVNDPIARIMRKWVKDNRINDKIPVLSSSEVPLKKGKIVSTMCFVPNVAGILMANYIIRNIIDNKKKIQI